MEILKVVIVSIVQGIAEFLPISSSGHILLFKKMLGLDLNLSFDLTIHLGTLFAVIAVYHKDIYELLKGPFVKSFKSDIFNETLYRKDTLKIYLLYIVATIPAGITGLLLKDTIEQKFTIDNTISFVFLGFFFMITALFLLSSELIKHKKITSIKDMTIKQALIVGVFQAVAVLPGVSRSGSTISGGIIAGVDRKDVGRFSFLLSIPLILAAFLLETKDMIEKNVYFSSDFMLNYIVGFFVSFIIGIVSLKLLLALIGKGKVWYFSIYLILPIVVSLFFGFSR